MNYSRITPKEGMVMKRPPVMIPLSGRVPGRSSEPSRTRVADGGGCGTFCGLRLGCLGFSRERQFIVEGAMSVEARGLLTTWWRARGGTHATTWCGRLVSLLRLSFGLRGCVEENRSMAFRFIQFREYFLNNFSETRNCRKQATGTIASC